MTVGKNRHLVGAALKEADKINIFLAVIFNLLKSVLLTVGAHYTGLELIYLSLVTLF